MATIIIFICIGIFVFIFGLIILTKSLKNFSQKRIRTFINKYTRNTHLSILIGFILTVFIQSSSMVTIISVSMADAGLIKLFNAAGIIMGANIGTTIAVQLYAFNLFKLVPYAIFVGSILHFQKKMKFKIIGNILLGFGVIFSGLKIMDIAVKPLRNIDEVIGFLKFISNPYYSILIGVIMALIMQSSNIGIAILQILASSNLISVYNALFIIYGLNIGTCSEALIMSFATNKEGKKIALFNIVFNIIGTIFFIPITKYYFNFLRFLSPFNILSQIANGHMLFNIITTLIMLPIMKYIFSFIEIFLNASLKHE